MRTTPSSRIFFIIADARQRVRLFATYFRVFPIRRRISYDISSNTASIFCPPTTTNPPPLHCFFALHHKHQHNPPCHKLPGVRCRLPPLHFLQTKYNTHIPIRRYPTSTSFLPFVPVPSTSHRLHFTSINYGPNAHWGRGGGSLRTSAYIHHLRDGTISIKKTPSKFSAHNYTPNPENPA